MSRQLSFPLKNVINKDNSFAQYEEEASVLRSVYKDYPARPCNWAQNFIYCFKGYYRIW